MRLLFVCLGGAAGTAARYLLGGWTARWLGAEFPFGTLLVNVTGSFLIGLIHQVGLTSRVIPDMARLVLTVGVMGGFTTYSAFSYETVVLVERGAWAHALAYVALTTVLCLGACALGVILGRGVIAGRVW